MRMEAYVSGRVQGVNFRYYTRRRALSLGLRGVAENLPDGRVRVVAEGPEEALRVLLEFLREGPPLARVDGVQVSWSLREEGLEGFEIR